MFVYRSDNSSSSAAALGVSFQMILKVPTLILPTITRTYIENTVINIAGSYQITVTNVTVQVITSHT